jgi:hypothetical protein
VASTHCQGQLGHFPMLFVCFEVFIFPWFFVLLALALPTKAKDIVVFRHLMTNKTLKRVELQCYGKFYKPFLPLPSIDHANVL